MTRKLNTDKLYNVTVDRRPAGNMGLQKWRFSAPQTHLWLIKHWFSASTFVVKIPTFAKPETVTA
jgi:hypothetical protein